MDGSLGEDAPQTDAASDVSVTLDAPFDTPLDALRDTSEIHRECEFERCDDGLDGDCDGQVDEGCDCSPGEVASCFRGMPSERGVGICADGTMVCTGFEFGLWGPCEGDRLAGEEVCDVGGLDEDCDGAPNDGCECSNGDPDVACGLMEGACMSGLSKCVDGRRGECEGATFPGVETCDGVDEDCDGRVDEGLTRDCGVSGGTCRMGVETCSDGAWGLCEGEVAPRAEACDGLDEDCDGMVDEELIRACGTDEGVCVAGSEICSAGSWSACSGAVGAGAESCDGRDEDCDGSTDEALSRTCGSDVGECQVGTETCGGGAWGTCVGERLPGVELCEGSLDEDCDGGVDEGCECIDGTTRDCGTDVGVCSFGTQTCSTRWGVCVGAVGPGTERCEGTLDEDCDGTVDEGCECTIGGTRSCGTTDVGLCQLGIERCDDPGLWGTCGGAIEPATEVCNGNDDDCDGAIDERDVCPRFPPTVMCPGVMSGLVGQTFTLSGGGSDPDGGVVAFAWTVVARPAGSSASPAPANAATTMFTPDRAGAFTLRLCVTDDEGEVRCCTTGVTATSACTVPTAPSISACGDSWDRRPVVELTPLPSGVVYTLLADGVAYDTVALVGQNYSRAPTAIGVGGPPPGLSVELVARACRVSDPTCCASSTPVDVRLIESCTTPVAPTASNILFSEYVTNGDGACPGAACEAGEAIEITNLSHCPVDLAGTHFGYCNPGSCSAFRWMDFGVGDVIPPRGVYVAIRNQEASMCDYPFFGPDDPALFGLRISRLDMQGSSLATGWFNNSGGGQSVLRLATGAFVDIMSGTTLERIAPYRGSAPACSSIGFDAIDECGVISAVAEPTDVLTPNQLGRLWHPCDAVVSPMPAACR